MSFSPSVKRLTIGKDPFSQLPDGTRSVPQYVIQKVLSANTAYSITVPTGAVKVILSADVNFFANCNGTASITTATDGSGSELNPEGYLFNSDDEVTAISVISASAGNITAAFYSAQ